MCIRDRLCAAFQSHLQPQWVPPLPPEALIYKEPHGASGHRSLIVLMALATLAGYAWAQVHNQMMHRWFERIADAPADETFIMSMLAGALVALVLALANKGLRLGLISKLAERVTFVLIPPLVLIFLGIATPTEGGAMGAVGALIMSLARRRLSYKLLKQALENSACLSSL